MLSHLKMLAPMVCFLLLSGCSIKVAYNNLDRFVRWGVSDYVDLTDAQTDVLNREIKKIHLWHRRNHLPLYAEFTSNLAVSLTDDVTPRKLADIFAQFEIWAHEIEREVTPVVIEILELLTDAQVAALPGKLQRANDEFAEPESDLSLEEAQAQWAEDFADGIRNFVGRLSREQLAYVERRSTEYAPERVLWAEYRSRWQKELVGLLEDRKSEAFPERYRALVAHREEYYGSKLTAVFANNERLNQEVGAYLLDNLSERQTARLVEKLTELSEDFDALSRQDR